MNRARSNLHVGRSERAARLCRPVAFAGVAFSLAVIFAASGSPIPLYARYRATNHFTSGDVSLSAIFLISYTGAAVPGFIAGRLAGSLRGLTQILAGYAGLAGIACVVVLVAPRNPSTNRKDRS